MLHGQEKEYEKLVKERAKEKAAAVAPIVYPSQGKMYRTPAMRPTGLNVNQCVQGETIEMKVERAVHNKEPITDGAPMLYMERGAGVQASTNIRTDRWEVAVDASDKIAKSYMARREAKAKQAEAEANKGKEVGKAESSQGTGGDSK